jgi:hypothetical protein
MAHHPTQRQPSTDQRIQDLTDQTNIIVACAKELEERGVFQLVEASYRLKRTPPKKPGKALTTAV